MIGKNTEKQLKAWLKCSAYRHGEITSDGKVRLYDEANVLIATFTIRSIIQKRYPRKKKAVRK